MPATCPSPRRKAGAAFRPKASPRVCGRSRGVFRNPDSVNSFGFIFLPFTIQHPASAGRAPENSALRRFSVPRFAPSTSSAQIIGICLYAAMRSAGASLWQLTKPPFSPKWGIPSFVKKEAKGGQNRRGPILSAGGYLPPTRLRRRSVKKCYRHLKFRAVIPARCPGSAGANFTDNGLRKILEIFHSPVPARCLTDIRISTDEGAITQAQSDPKRGITPCPSSGRLYVRRIPADPVTFFCEQAGITLKRDSVFMILLLMC